MLNDRAKAPPGAPDAPRGPAAPGAPAPRLVALAGNPNVGKTTVFNQLTGLRQKVGNYPGVTVERKTGVFVAPSGERMEIVDVPGTYSLAPKSLDEEIAYQVLVGAVPGTRRPDLVVCVVDASNLERNLYLASQIMDLGIPTLLALNMVDAAKAAGLEVDAKGLQKALGVPVVELVASRGTGMGALKARLGGELPEPAPRRWELDAPVEAKVAALAERMAELDPDLPRSARFAEALRALTTDHAEGLGATHRDEVKAAAAEARAELEADDVPWEQAEIIGRYGWLTPLAETVVRRAETERRSVSDRIDAVVTHRVLGPILFLVILVLIFQAVFTWAQPVMDWLDAGVTSLGSTVRASLPPGLLSSLLVDGVIAGVGAVIVFLPQILILFFFLGLLEDTGYMARAAFIMDRVMRRVGLSGRSVVPMLSGFACAVPGIMAARTIDNQRDRLVTILVTPLMTCSARLPVYALLIAAVIPDTKVFGFIGAQGLTLTALYLLGVLFAVAAAYVIKKFVVKGKRTVFVMELPPYRRPRLRDVAWRMVERSKIFLTRAGTIILAVSVVLWFLASFPRAKATPELAQARQAAVTHYQQVRSSGAASQAELTQARSHRDAAIAEAAASARARQLSSSAMGWLGHAIEPVIRPLGYDWKIGVSLIASLAAREVVVSSLATIYAVGDVHASDQALQTRLLADVDPRTGERVFTLLTGLSLMMFFVLACQCMSTIAIVRRETNSWKWPAFLFTYMTGLAWIFSFLVYQGGHLLGLS